MYQNENWQLIFPCYCQTNEKDFVHRYSVYTMHLSAHTLNSSSLRRALVSIVSYVSPCHSTMLDSKTSAEHDSVLFPINWDTGSINPVSSKGVLDHCRYTVLVFTSMNTSEEICYSVKLRNWTLQMRQRSLAIFSDGLCIRSFMVLQVESQKAINGLDAAVQLLSGVWKQPSSSQWPMKEGDKYKE